MKDDVLDALKRNNKGCEFAELYYLIKLRKPPKNKYHCANLGKDDKLLECPFECCIKEELRGKERLAHLAEKLLTLLE
jgi:hypothetical protein